MCAVTGIRHVWTQACDGGDTIGGAFGEPRTGIIQDLGMLTGSCNRVGNASQTLPQGRSIVPRCSEKEQTQGFSTRALVKTAGTPSNRTHTDHTVQTVAGKTVSFYSSHKYRAESLAFCFAVSRRRSPSPAFASRSLTWEEDTVVDTRVQRMAATAR